LSREHVERRLTAILAADVAGYSRLMGADEEGVLARLKVVRKSLVDPKIAEHRGRIVKTTGDGMLVEFASAVDAARCGIDIQCGMAEQNAAVAQEQRIEFRIGIHVGDIIIDEKDIFGDGVNIAARLEGIAEPGGVCISDDAQRQIRGKIHIPFEDMGPQNLKNIIEPMRAWRLRIDANSSALPSPKPSIETATPLPIPDKPSIAVLPFQNMSGDPEQEYFADGIVEEVITALSRFKSLFVIARNSTFTYKGKAVDIKKVGRELGVRYVLEGSVRKAGGRVRITGQLIEVATGAHLWANKFEGDLQDIFQMQDRVTISVVGAIEPRLIQAEIEFAKRKPPGTWNTYDRYLRGVALVYQLTPAGLSDAMEEFRQAIALDPDFALALAMLAACAVARRFFHGQVLTEAEVSAALGLASRATELAPDDERVLAFSALVFAFLNDEFERASVLAERAIELNPNQSLAWTILGWANAWLGEPERARKAFDHTVRLNPLDKPTLVQILPGYIVVCFISGQHEERRVWANRLLALDPTNLSGLLALLDVAGLQERSADAAEILVRMRTAYPDLRASHVKQIFLKYRKLEHRALFDDFLKRVGLPE
jgi:TolB-like protein/class 3 adenylate cyclase/tetratricopeptide (TPR) repeat protein